MLAVFSAVRGRCGTTWLCADVFTPEGDIASQGLLSHRGRWGVLWMIISDPFLSFSIPLLSRYSLGSKHMGVGQYGGESRGQGHKNILTLISLFCSVWWVPDLTRVGGAPDQHQPPDHRHQLLGQLLHLLSQAEKQKILINRRHWWIFYGYLSYLDGQVKWLFPKTTWQ